VPGKLRKVYGPYLMLLPPEKIAVIGLNSTVNLILKSANQGVQVTTLSRAIGELIQSSPKPQNPEKMIN
jgi:DNA-directed RNA polymerase